VHGIATMCRVLDVTRSGFYEWLRKPLSDRAIEDLRLLDLIRASYAASSGVHRGVDRLGIQHAVTLACVSQRTYARQHNCEARSARRNNPLGCLRDKRASFTERDYGRD